MSSHSDFGYKCSQCKNVSNRPAIEHPWYNLGAGKKSQHEVYEKGEGGVQRFCGKHEKRDKKCQARSESERHGARATAVCEVMPLQAPWNPSTTSTLPKSSLCHFWETSPLYLGEFLPWEAILCVVKGW
ncbi:hypothetical protein SNE40_012608 [Patella caerulea]|uniref:Uncharacterized protein n=1 Tax=Patella caerulea TaxID=87958 RepID=A0AAN8JPB0_PATCE